jgi:hypothetical protein
MWCLERVHEVEAMIWRRQALCHMPCHAPCGMPPTAGAWKAAEVFGEAARTATQVHKTQGKRRRRGGPSGGGGGGGGGGRWCCWQLTLRRSQSVAAQPVQGIQLCARGLASSGSCYEYQHTSPDGAVLAIHSQMDRTSGLPSSSWWWWSPEGGWLAGWLAVA